jgi:hypothetical protein
MALGVSAIGVFSEVENFSWLVVAGVVAYMATGIQLVVGRRPPRLLWLIVGCFIFWYAGRYWIRLGFGTASSGPSLQVLALAAGVWTMSALRLVGVGIEELI